MTGRYYLDLFSGEGGVARSIRRLGFDAREFDVRHGVESDLCREATLRRIVRDIAAGRVAGVMLAPPCGSFSTAQDRGGAVRSRASPWGLEGLGAAARERVEAGNRCLRACLRVCRACDKARVPLILENPHSSKMFYVPELVRLGEGPRKYHAVCDQCAYGTPWRKRARFICAHLDEQDLSRIQGRCRGQRGICFFTEAKHHVLSGSAGGTPWTRLAQTYPSRLASDLAFVLTEPARHAYAARASGL